MNATTARRRGADTQRAVAAHLAGNGWPHATDAGAGRAGSDILGVPGLGIEVKGRRNFDPGAWLKQAAKGSQGIPLCVHRPYGAGVATVGRWPVLMHFDDAIRLLRLAGYGDPLPDDEAVA